MNISVGFPTLIPMLIMLAFNILSGLFTFGDDEEVIEPHTFNTRSRTGGQGYAYTNTRNTGMPRGGQRGHETGGFSFTMYPELVMLLVFVALPFLIKKVMRN